MINLILHEYKIFNAQVLFRDDYTSDEFIDVVVGRRVYLPCLYVSEWKNTSSHRHQFPFD